MISKEKREPAVEAVEELEKAVKKEKDKKPFQPVDMKKPPMGTPRLTKKPLAKSYQPKTKKPKVDKNPKLNVAELINFIKNGQSKTAIAKLKEYQCSSPEGCGFVIFHDNLCFNHYHVKMKYGRTNRVNTKHNGELCSVCKMRPATNKDKCLPCYARQKYHADKAKGIIKSKAKPVAKVSKPSHPAKKKIPLKKKGK